MADSHSRSSPSKSRLSSSPKELPDITAAQSLYYDAPEDSPSTLQTPTTIPNQKPEKLSEKPTAAQTAALRAFNHDYTTPSHTSEALSSYHNTVTNYQPSIHDWQPTSTYIHPWQCWPTPSRSTSPTPYIPPPHQPSQPSHPQYSNPPSPLLLIPARRSHHEHHPECNAFWADLLSECTDAARLFRQWDPSRGRQVFSIGSVVVRSYHNIPPQYVWYDFTRSDQEHRMYMSAAATALEGMGVKVPEVLFAGWLDVVVDREEVLKRNAQTEEDVEQMRTWKKVGVLVTKRLPGIALDSIIAHLPPEIVRDLRRQIEAIEQRLRDTPSPVQRSEDEASAGSRVFGEMYPGPEGVKKTCDWFDMQWARKLQKPFRMTPDEAMGIPEGQVQREPFTLEPEGLLEGSLEDALSSLTRDVLYVDGNPLNSEAPFYGGPESDVDVDEGGLTPRNVVVSGGRVVGIRGVAIHGLFKS